MVGDTEYDMQMAKNAGVDALAVCYGVHEPERLQMHDPLDCISDLRDIPDWLEQLHAGGAQRLPGPRLDDKLAS
jgi:phosphoglycolate phosphatase